MHYSCISACEVRAVALHQRAQFVAMMGSICVSAVQSSVCVQCSFAKSSPGAMRDRDTNKRWTLSQPDNAVVAVPTHPLSPQMWTRTALGALALKTNILGKD